MSATILVVDDEPDMLLMVRTLLELAGHRVLEATTGEDALEILGHQTPDAVLLDIRLPGIDGWEVLERLRSRGRLGDLRVIMLSASVDATTAERAKSFGCRGWVGKPFMPDDLIHTIERALAG